MGPEEIREQMNATRASLDEKLDLIERRMRPAARRTVPWVALFIVAGVGAAVWSVRARRHRRRRVIPIAA